MKLGRKVARHWRALMIVVAAIGVAAAFSTATHATAPPYQVMLDNTEYTGEAGSTFDVGVSIDDLGGTFTSGVQLCVKVDSGGAPGGTTASIAGDVTFAAGDYAQQTMTVTLSSNLSAADHNMWVAACDGSDPAAGAPFLLHVTTPPPPPPDYSIGLGSSSDQVFAGQSQALGAIVHPTNGFSSDVSMCLYGDSGGSPGSLPTGITLSGTPVSFTSGTYAQQLTILTALSTAPGDYTLYVGDCGGTHYSDAYVLTVNQPSFDFQVVPDDITAFSGTTIQPSADVTSDPGFSGTIDFTLSGSSPPGFTPGVWDKANIPGLAGLIGLPITIAPDVATGDYILPVVGTAEGSSLPTMEHTITVHVVHPSVDGSGTLTVEPQVVGASTSGNVLAFQYTAADGGLNNGAVTIDVPTGWSAPSPDNTTAGQGSVSVSGRTITVSGVTLQGGEGLQITYGDNGGVTAPSATGSQDWPASEKSTSDGTLTALGTPPSVLVSPAPGLGTMSVTPTSALVGSDGNTLTFTYTAGTGGLDHGVIGFQVPYGWSDPSTDSSEPGYVTSPQGSPGASGGGVFLSDLTLSAGQTATIVYGDTSLGGPGATAPSDGGTSEFTTYETPNTFIDPAELAQSPEVDVVAPDGSGTMTPDPTHAGIGSTGNTLTFEYQPGAGGMVDGSVTLTVPTGWSAPSQDNSAPGYVSIDNADAQLSITNRTITVSELTLPDGYSLHLTYGDTSAGSPGATAPGTGGLQDWPVQQKSTPGGTLTDIASPQVEIVAADGSGTMAVDHAVVIQGTSDQSETFTYTAAAGGMHDGVVGVTVPDDWDLPQVDFSDQPGYASASTGDVSTDGTTIFASNVTLAAGETMTISYEHATVPSTGEVETWNAYQQSTADGWPHDLAVSPTVSIVSADGSGAMTVDPTQVGKGVSGNTLDFTYTADPGGLINGAITIVVPAGWTAPSLAHTDPGFTSADQGTVTVSPTLITVSGVNLGDGETLGIHYGDKSFGSSGAKSSSTPGDQTWTTSEKSTAAGTLTPLVVDFQPVVTVIPPPTITDFGDTANDPPTKTGLAGDPVTITGTHFDTATDVQFNGTSVSDFTIDDENTIETTVPDGATTGKISVINPGGTATSTGNFTVIVAPEIDSFTPATGKVGTLVTLNGHGFTGADPASGGEVDFGGTPADSYTVVSDTKITATVPDGATTGSITVTNPADTADSGDSFTVVQQPFVDVLTPDIGGVGMTIEIDGSGFDTGPDPKFKDVVKFGGKAATVVDVQDDNTIFANVPSGAKTGVVTVTNIAGTGTSSDAFTVVLPPTLASFTPLLALPGAAIQLKGAHFTGTTDVTFGGDIAADDFTVNSDTSITVTVPDSAETGQISVTNAGGTTTSKASFGVIVPPQFDDWSTDNGKIGAVVTLYGSGFVGTTGVTFAGAVDPVAAKFKTVNDGVLQATVPKGAVSGTIEITNAAGSASSGDGPGDFTVILPPKITSFSPSPGPAAVGDSVQIFGSGFTGATVVKFGGVAADFELIDDTEIDSSVPAGAKTGKLTVTNAAGTGSSTSAFAVIPPPTVASFSPLTAAGGSGATVIIKGTNFYASDPSTVTEVDFGDATDTVFTVDSKTQITATLPDDATTGPIYVYTSDHGYARSAKSFGVIISPSVDGFTPDNQKIGGNVTITGSGFTGVTSVTFNGVAAKFTVKDDFDIAAVVPKGATTGQISVHNAAGDSTSVDDFTVVLPAKISGFTPSSGAAGDTVTITGTGFTGVTAVKFSGVSAGDFTVDSDTQITVTVPDGAKKGKISVTNAAGTASSTAQFTPTG